MAVVFIVPLISRINSSPGARATYHIIHIPHHQTHYTIIEAHMQLPNIIAIATFACLAAAIPLLGPAPPIIEALTKRSSPHHVYQCTGQNWSGKCMVSEYTGGVCMTIFNGGVGSFGPDPGVSCTLYQGAQCQDSAYTAQMNYPGSANIGTGYYSYRCSAPVYDTSVVVVPVNPSGVVTPA